MVQCTYFANTKKKSVTHTVLWISWYYLQHYICISIKWTLWSVVFVELQIMNAFRQYMYSTFKIHHCAFVCQVRNHQPVFLISTSYTYISCAFQTCKISHETDFIFLLRLLLYSTCDCVLWWQWWWHGGFSVASKENCEDDERYEGEFCYVLFLLLLYYINVVYSSPFVQSKLDTWIKNLV